MPREQTNTHASGSGQQQPSEQLGKRPRPDSAHSGGKAAKKTAAGGPPWAVPTAAAEPSAARPQPAAPRQLMKIRFSTAQAAEAAPAAPQGGRGGGAEAAGAAEVPQPTRRATPSPPHERQQPGAAAAAAAAPAAAALGPSHAAASKKFVRHRAAEPAAAAANALTSVVAALRAENDALRAQLADAKEHLDAATAQADELEAEVETLTVRVDVRACDSPPSPALNIRRACCGGTARVFDVGVSRAQETHALLRRERWERSQEQQANEQWRRDTQSRVDSVRALSFTPPSCLRRLAADSPIELTLRSLPQEHEIAAEATRRADTLQAQLDSVRTDPGAVLRHLRETAALAQLPGPRLSDLKARVQLPSFLTRR